MKKNLPGNTPASNKPILYVVAINLALSLAFFGWNFFSTNNQVVYVDSIKLLSAYKGMEIARKEFDGKVSTWNANLDTLKFEMDAKFKEYELKGASLSTKERGLMEELLETKREQYQNYQQMISEKIKKEDQELTTKVYTKVNEYIKKYGEDKGYSFILGANQYGSIVYAESAVDITDEVLVGLNKEFTRQ